MTGDRTINTDGGDYRENTNVSGGSTYVERNFNGSVSSTDNRGKQTNVAGVNYGVQMNTSPELAAIVEEIQSLIGSPQPTGTVEQMKVATEAIQKLEGNPTLKQRAINAAKGGLMEGIKQTPVGAIVAGVIEGWTKEG